MKKTERARKAVTKRPVTRRRAVPAKSFVVLGPMAYFKVPAYDVTEFDPDVLLRPYKKAVRDFGRFNLRPLIVDWGRKGRRSGWSMEPQSEDGAYVSAPNSIYQLEITDPALTAANLSDCITGMRALMYAQVNDEYVLVPLGKYAVPPSRKIPIDVIREAYRLNFEGDAGYVEPEPMFDVRSTNGIDWDDRLWRTVSATASNELVVYASHFLRAAFSSLLFQGDDFLRALRQPEEKAHKIREAVEVENSIHNCYKAIEAVYGGTLAKDWAIVEKRFSDKGVDLSAASHTHSFPRRKGEPWLDKLISLREARDDRAAHGRIHASRKSTYHELMDYQVLAMYVLRRYVEHLYPVLAK